MTTLMHEELIAALAAVERLYGVRVIALTPAPWTVVYGEPTLDAWAAAVGPAYGDADGDADVDPVGEGWDDGALDDEADADADGAEGAADG
jgi:hypothetical protein